MAVLILLAPLAAGSPAVLPEPCFPALPLEPGYPAADPELIPQPLC